MGDTDRINNRADFVEQSGDDEMKNGAALKPKGACWYCNQPLDNVRRFCNKTCAEDYRTEEEALKFKDVRK